MLALSRSAVRRSADNVLGLSPGRRMVAVQVTRERNVASLETG